MATATRRKLKDDRSTVQKLKELIERGATEGERDAARRMLERALRKAAKSGGTAPGGKGAGAAAGSGFEDHRVYGSKYDQVSRMGLAEIAALMRQDVKLARKLGDGPAEPGDLAISNPLAAMPKGVKVSIRSEYFSGGGAIRIRVKEIPEDWGFVTEPDRYRPDVMVKVPSPAFAVALDQLREIHWAYNYDGSDIQVDHFDRNYYGGVDYDRPRD